MPVKGLSKHLARLRRLQGPAMTKAVSKALFAAGELIEDEAKGLIMAGSVSGKQHVASLPGEPPNNDSFTLHNNIETARTADPLVVTVTSNAEHSTPLEFGTSKMAARPFMRPARDAKVKEAQALVAKAVNQIAKKGA